MHSFFETFANRTVADAWLVGMLPLLVKSVVILGAAGVVAHVLKNSAAALRHLVWLTAIGGILFLPAMSRVLPSIHVPISNLIGEAGPVADGNRAATLQTGDNLTFAPRSDASRSGVVTTTPRERLTTGEPGGVSGVITNLKAVPWTVWLFVVWVAGTAVLLVRLVFSHVSALALVRRSTIAHDDDLNLRLERHARRMSVHRRVRLRESDWLDVPVTVGSIRPVILLPRESVDWDSATRDAVLLHELAHIRRLDCLAQTLVESVRAFLWINPLAWVAESEMRVERERACDDLVITSGTRASSYAQTLLELAGSIRGRDRTSAAVMAMARRSDLEGRLLDILDDGPRLRNVNRVGAALAVLVVFSFVLPVAALSPAQDANQERRDSADAVTFSDADFDFEFADVAPPDVPVEFSERFSESLNDRLAFVLSNLAGMNDTEGILQGAIGDVADVMSEIEYELSEVGLRLAPYGQAASDTLTIDQLIQLARHGVDAEYIEALRAAGYSDLSFETLLSFARQGIDPDYIAELSAAGLGSLPAEDLIALSRHGIDADLIVALQNSGFTNLGVDDVVGLARHGIDDDDIAEYGALGFSNLSVEQLIDLARHGVDPQEMRRYMDLGFKNIGVEEFVDLARFGVDEELVVELANAGYANLDVESIVSLSRRGVDGDLIEGLRAQGYDNLKIEDIADAARRGLDVDCIEALNAAGYGRFSFETLIQFARYDVDADYIEELVDAGITDLTADEIVKLRKNGIDADYIKKVRNDR